MTWVKLAPTFAEDERWLEAVGDAMAVHVSSLGDADAQNGVSTSVTRGPGVGVQFWGLAGPERSLWDDFVREQIAQKKMATKK